MADPVGIAEETLAKIAACDDQAIFTRVTRDRALAEARAARQRSQSAGPLDGVPVAWKDLFDLQGMTTPAGSVVLADAPPAERDAPVVANLAKAGMICVGRTNMTEFAYSGIGLNPHYGTPRNPHGKEPRVPGGSSSGSAVAVARGLVPVAIGTDTGGSVRLPAAVNGVVGFKATVGRYPMAGVFPLSPTLDSLGLFARTVEMAAQVDAAMRGVAAAAPSPRSPVGVRIVVPTNIVLDDCEPAVQANFSASLERLAYAGARIEYVAVPAFDEIGRLSRTHGTILAAEAHAAHRSRLEDGSAVSRMDHRVVSRLEAGSRITLADYLAVVFARQRLIEETNALLADGFIAFPTAPIVAPTIASVANDDDRFFAANAKILRNTSLGNVLGWCGVSLPNGVDGDGMPTALMLSATGGCDDALLALAQGCETIVRGE
jgi:aspartyl-tRNA(Asn)/glutamyl-tRNA(Gln) amidotransferase subunit A